MELSRVSTIISVILVCVFCEVKGNTKVIPDDEASQNNSDDSISDSGDMNIRGQYN